MGAPPGDQGARRTRPQGRRHDPPPSHQRPPRPAQRKPADEAANYLTNKAPYLDYPTALTNGWPIATGIVEGACRHLIKDRMDITGARWGLAGAEAILKLRAIKANGDFEEYWRYHLAQERHHVHEARYHNHTIPSHMTGHPRSLQKSRTRLLLSCLLFGRS